MSWLARGVERDDVVVNYAKPSVCGGGGGGGGGGRTRTALSTPRVSVWVVELGSPAHSQRGKKKKKYKSFYF